jgi:putative colanic acid biosysnthesis UDP-glucose lipid carrier transferase
VDFNRKGIFNEYGWLIVKIQRLFDLLIIISLLILSTWVYNVPFKNHYYVLTGIIFFLVPLVFGGANLYRPWRGVTFLKLVQRVFLSWAVVISILTVLAFTFKVSAEFSRSVVLTWGFITPEVIIVSRLLIYAVLHWARTLGLNYRTAVIAGAGDLGKNLAKKVIDTPWLGIRLIGFFDDKLSGEDIELGREYQNVPVVGTLDGMADFVKKKGVDMVYLALPLRAGNRMRQAIKALEDTTASVYFVPDVFTFSLLRMEVADLRGVPIISLWETPFFGINGLLKRSIDIVLASLTLLSTSFLLLFIALGVKLSSPGPVIFRQRRYGLDGQEFLIYKFRTMRVCEDGAEVAAATRFDPRVTRFGAFLRRTSLDELPQFFNVLEGTMSLVGPRPLPIAYNELYRHRIQGFMLRHKIRPGLTGWAQLNGFRGDTDDLRKMQGRVKHDLYYLSHWSLWLDIKIIFLTAFKILTDRNAY